MKPSQTKRGPYQVRMIGWKDEPPWNMLKEGPEVSTLLAPNGLERHVPNSWFRRTTSKPITRRRLLK